MGYDVFFSNVVHLERKPDGDFGSTAVVMKEEEVIIFVSTVDVFDCTVVRKGDD